MPDPIPNVLFDPLLPVDDGCGQVRKDSIADILLGKVNATRIVHAREDFVACGTQYIAAIAQAIYPAATVQDLSRRIAGEIPDGLLGVLQEFRGDFNLTGPKAFLQPGSLDDPRGPNATQRMILDAAKTSGIKLTRYGRRFDALCSSCSLLALYCLQANATAGGAGYSPGVRGSPALTTLIVQPTLRATAWANTLALDVVRDLAWWPNVTTPPWQPLAQSKVGEEIGLAEGLLWQPRGLRLEPCSDGQCMICGAQGPRYAAHRFLRGKGSKVAGGFYHHPHTPWYEDEGKPRHRLLPLGRPAWTGLADMLPQVRKTVSRRDPEGSATFAAPVVHQWFERLGKTDVRLLVFGYRSDGQSKILARFGETWHIEPGPGAARSEHLRWLVTRASETLSALQYALRRAWSAKKKEKRSYWPEVTRTEFWRQTEEPFLSAKAEIERGGTDLNAFLVALRTTALELYDRQTAKAAIDSRHQALVVRARTRLLSGLAKALRE